MAAPNIVNVSAIYGKTAVTAATTSAATIVSNAVGSNCVLKINMIVLANYTGNVVTATVEFLRSSVAHSLANAVSIPANSTLVVSGKDTAFYMEEGDAMQVSASSGTSVSATVSYEIIS